MAIERSYYTPKEAAATLGIHYHTLLRYIRDRDPAIKGMPFQRLARNVIRIPRIRFHKWCGLD